MDIKKTPRADLENERSLIFSFSLVITLSMVIMAFEWKQPERSDDKLVGRGTNAIDNTIDVPVTEIQPPAPPTVLQQPRIIEVPDDEQIEEEIEVKFDMEMTENTKVTEFTIAEPSKVVEEEVTDEIFLVVEESASPKDGIAAFYKDIGERLKYPGQAIRLGIEGRVFVEFVVNKDGSITDVVAVKGIGAGCDEEAIRVIQTSPKWNPGKQRGRPVRQRMVLPITFRIQQRYL